MSATATKFPALYTAHCPNGPTHCCDEHARQIRGLFGFLGAHVALTAAPDNSECANCANAAAAIAASVPEGQAKEGK
jgi:hypothetical protein